MIKKLLSALLLISSVSVVNTYAQCTANVSCIPTGTAYGICPDSATGLAAGTVGVPYSQTISIKVPPNAAPWGQPSATIDSLVITSVDSLAPGLTYTCVPHSCGFVPGIACLVITGTPTAVWNKLIIVHIDGHVKVSGIPINSGDKPNKQYRSIVHAATGIETLDLTKFDVEQNAPNPFGDKSTIRFSSVNSSDVEFKVYNMVGAAVYTTKFKASKGANTITIEANSFAPGVYMYSIKNGDTTITKRMVVSGK